MKNSMQIDWKQFVKKAPRALFVYLGVSIIAVLFGCADDSGQTDAKRETPSTDSSATESDSTYRAVIVTVFSADQKPPGQKFTQICRGASEAKLESKRLNRIMAIPVKLGDKVEKGDVIIYLDSSVESSAFLSALAVEKSATVAEEKAQRDLERAESKFNENLISSVALETARLALESANAARGQANAAVALAKQNLRDTRIVSPIDGAVTYLPYEVGETPPMSMVVAEISNKSSVMLDLFLSETMIHEFKVGDSAVVQSKVDTSRRYSGQITAISPKGDDRTQLFKAELSINNSDGFLKSGMTLTAELFSSAENRKLFLPIDALQFRNDSSFVALVENGTVSFKAVSTGSRVGASATIPPGALNDGDTLVIVGAAGLQSKQRVRIVREVAFDSLLN